MAHAQAEAPSCKQNACRGLLLEADGGCLAHTSPELRQARLKQLRSDGVLNARGVPIDRGLLEEILEAAPRGTASRPQLRHADFGGAQFGDRPYFGAAQFGDGADFGGAQFGDRAYFGGAQFGDEAFFRRAQFGDDADFGGAQFGDRAHFRGARFGDWTDFGAARFGDGAHFGGARFGGRVDFGGARFGDRAYFRDGRFGDDADFGGAQFGDRAYFGGAQFGDRADFHGAQFGDEAYFRDARFRDAALFRDARFGDWTDFGGAQFGDRADFRDARFGDRAIFGPLLVRGRLELSHVIFNKVGGLDIAAQHISCTRLGLLEGAPSFRVRCAEVNFAETDFSKPTIVAPLPLTAWAQPPSDLPDWASVDDQRSRPRVISLSRANVAELVLTDVDLVPCRLAGAHNLDQLRLEGDITFARPPAGWRRTGRGWWRWTRRDTLAEEQQWRARPDYPKRAGWYSHETDAVPRTTQELPGEPLGPRRIASLYRDLRKAREDAKDEAGAADFYYGEMEMRRLDPSKPKAERMILLAYWLVSGYGLRAWRALACLGVLWLVASALLVTAGFSSVSPPPTASSAPATTPADPNAAGRKPSPGSPPRPAPSPAVASATSLPAALVFTARTAIGLPQDPRPDLTRWGDVLQIGWRIVAPLLVGLAVLSIRGRVKR